MMSKPFLSPTSNPTHYCPHFSFWFDFMPASLQHPRSNKFDHILWNSSNPVSGPVWSELVKETHLHGQGFSFREVTLNCSEAVQQMEFDGRSYHYFNAALIGPGRYFDCPHVLIFVSGFSSLALTTLHSAQLFQPDTDHYQYEWMGQPYNDQPGKSQWVTTEAFFPEEWVCPAGSLIGGIG